MRIWGFFAAQELDPRDVKIIAPLKVAEKMPLGAKFWQFENHFHDQWRHRDERVGGNLPRNNFVKISFLDSARLLRKKNSEAAIFEKSEPGSRALGGLETGKSEDNLKAKKVEPVSSRGTLSPIKIFTREKKIYSFSDFSRGRIFSLATRFFGLTTVFFRFTADGKKPTRRLSDFRGSML